MIKNAARETLLIVTAAIVISIMVNALRPDGLPFFGGNNTPSIDGQGFVEEIDINDAYVKHKNRTALFVDARSPEDYSLGHIKDAINLPEQQFDQWIEAIIRDIDPRTEIVTYCSSVDCPQARGLAEKLCQSGFEKVLYLPGGYDLWVQKQFPVNSEETKKPLSGQGH